MPTTSAPEPRRRARSARHVCAACRERRARFKHRGEVRADRLHVLCFQCYRAARERLRAWQFRETYAPSHRYLRPEAVEHRRRMLAHLEAQVAGSSSSRPPRGLDGRDGDLSYRLD